MGGMDVKRTIITVALIGAIWIVWMKFFLPKPASTPAPAPALSAQAGQKIPASPDAGAAAAQTPRREAAKPAEAAGSEVPRPSEQRVALEGKQFRATFSSWGGALVSFELKDPQYREKLGAAEGALDLVKPHSRPELTTSF